MNSFIEKVTLPTQGLSPTFIGSWTMNPLSICDELVAYFELNKNKQQKGVIGSGKDLDAKNSTDIKIRPKDIKLPGNEENLQIGEFNLQRYKSGQHFQRMHTERSGLSSLHRMFAWMTYLNDVDIKDGGSTFFSHYDLDIQPRKGLTLIWPAEWTHAHKGNLLKADSKYIITGWMHFPNNPNSL